MHKHKPAPMGEWKRFTRKSRLVLGTSVRVGATPANQKGMAISFLPRAQTQKVEEIEMHMHCQFGLDIIGLPATSHPMGRIRRESDHSPITPKFSGLFDSSKPHRTRVIRGCSSFVRVSFLTTDHPDLLGLEKTRNRSLAKRCGTSLPLLPSVQFPHPCPTEKPAINPGQGSIRDSQPEPFPVPSEQARNP